MRIPLLALAVAHACVPTGGLYRSHADTGPTSPDDTGGSGPDLSWWTGERVFSYDYGSYTCAWGTDTAGESGPRVVRGDPDFDRLHAACPECTALYRIEVAPDEVCGWIALSSLAFRGLAFSADTVAVWRLNEGAERLDAAGAWDGARIAYAYEDSAWLGDTEIPFDVRGTVAFPGG